MVYPSPSYDGCAMPNGTKEEKLKQNGRTQNGHSSYKNGHHNGHNGFKVPTQHSDRKLSKPAAHSFKERGKETFETVPIITAVLSYFGLMLILFVGIINKLFCVSKATTEKNRPGFVPLYTFTQNFFYNYMYRRVKVHWNCPITSVPGPKVFLKQRVSNDYGWTIESTGKVIECLNLGSYNYLGFAEAEGKCTEQTIKSIQEHSYATGSSRIQFGTNKLHLELEKLTAEYLGVEDAITFGMGFATNALNLPCLLSPGCLVLSDEKNHASLILGIRLSGATIRVFKHNNVKHLEKLLRTGIVSGQPDSGKPWKKILIVVEGVYSMEGSIVDLPGILALKQKYKAYIYLDEAHSIGALGKRGRGVLDYYGANPRQVDILMGTFTKSFGSAGGYIAGSKKLINFIRSSSHAHCYASSMSPPVTQQIISSMKTIMGLDGTGEGIRRVKQLRKNTVYFRRSLHKMGVIVHGNEDSPVVPLLVYTLANLSAVVKYLKNKSMAIVGVGFPATPLMEGRLRFCISASHTKEHLDQALIALEEVADIFRLKLSRNPRTKEEIVYDDPDAEISEDDSVDYYSDGSMLLPD